MMAKFMKTGSVIIDRLEERRLRRNADIIVAAMIKGFPPTDAEVGVGLRDQPFGFGNGVVFANRARRFACGLR